MARKKNGNVHPSRIFKSPNELITVWNEYKSDLRSKSEIWEKVQYVGKEGIRVVDNPMLPLTFEGFKRYCWDENIGSIEQYFLNNEGYYEDFVSVCSRIKNEIRENQITGGLLNFFNPSITQRLNNLVDKQESTVKVEQPLFGDDTNE